MAASDQKTYIERVAAQDPVKLVPSIIFECRFKLRLIREERHGHPCRCCQRGESGILALPPWSGLRVMGKEERSAHRAVAHTHKLTRVAERVVHLAGNRQFELQGAPHRLSNAFLLHRRSYLVVIEQADHG